MNYLQVVSAIILGLFVVGLGYIIIGGGNVPDINIKDNNSNSTSDLQFEHTFPNHTNIGLDKQFEAGPSYINGIRKHNKQIIKSSYTFTYSRTYNNSKQGTTMVVKSQPNEDKVYIERSLSTSSSTMFQEIYYSGNTQYIRIRPKNSSTNKWEHIQKESTFRKANRTAFTELKELEVPGVSFKLKKSIQQDNTTYFVYEPVIVDKEKFTSNRFVGGPNNPKNYSIKGEVLLSEYGLVTSVRMKYTVGPTIMNIQYSLKDIGSTTVSTPAWVQQS